MKWLFARVARAGRATAAAAVALLFRCVSSSLASITITTAPAAPVPVSEAVAVAASLSQTGGVASVELWFSPASAPAATNGNHVLLPSVGGGVYSNAFPFLPPGSYTWFVRALYDGGGADASAPQSLTVSPQMTYARSHDNRYFHVSSDNATFVPRYGWNMPSVLDTEFYANAPNASQWLAHGCGWTYDDRGSRHRPKLGASDYYDLSDPAFGIEYPVIYFYNLDPAEKPFVRSPRLEGGLGAVTFMARTILGNTSKVKVQISKSTSADPPEESWEDVEEYTLNAAPRNWAFTNVLNDAAVTYVRILRTERNLASTSPTAGFVAIDNIKISRPSSDVVLKELMHNPGYPAVNQPVTVRCEVKHADSGLPAFGRRMKVHYAWSNEKVAAIPAGWASTNMTLERVTGETEVYAARLPADAGSRTGYLHYYFQCDFNGHHLVPAQLIGTEYFNAGHTVRAAPPPSATHHCDYEIRPFTSRYGTVSLLQVVDGGAPVYYDMNLAGDNEWQVTAPVTADTTSEAYFIGNRCYLDGADAYATVAYAYGDEDQGEPFITPAGGRPERRHGSTNGLPMIRIDVARSGFLLYRLVDAVDATDLAYIVKRGVYQDFDTWVADPDHYTRSFFGAAIGAHPDDLEDWEMPLGWGEYDIVEEDFSGEPVGQDFNGASETPTEKGWARALSRCRNDRVKDTTLVGESGSVYSNMVVQVKVGGTLSNTQADTNANPHAVLAMPAGIGEIGLGIRSAIDDGAKALYNDHGWTYDETTPLVVETTFTIPPGARPDSFYSASLVFDYQDENNYHELRMTRVNSQNAYDQCIYFGLYRCLSGITTLVGGWGGSDWRFTATDARYMFKVEVRRKSPTERRTRMAVTFSATARGGNGVDQTWNNTWQPWDDNIESDLYLGGKVGFCAYDCVPNVKYLKVTGGTSGAEYRATSGAATEGFLTTFALTQNEWSLGGLDPTRDLPTSNPHIYRWHFDAADSHVLKRRIPRTTVNLWTTPCVGAESAPSPFAVYGKFRTLVVDSLIVENHVFPLHAWNKTFLSIRVADAPGDKGEGYVVVDYVRLTPWRASSRTPPDQFAGIIPPGGTSWLPCYDWTDESHQFSWYNDNPRTWCVLEGWVATNAAAVPPSPAVRFERSQANTNLVQALLTPLLTNGIGTVKFNYMVTGDVGTNGQPVVSGRVIYAVEYTEDGNIQGWGNVGVVYTNNVGDEGFHSFEVGENYGPGATARLRIRILEGSDPDVVLWLDDLYVNDSPPESADMWKVYNGCITTRDFGDPTRIFSGKSLFLNDSVDGDVPPRLEVGFDAHFPYLQSPCIAEGVGEIAFLYRAYDAAKPGLVAIDVAADEHAPDAEWRNLTNVVVNGSGYLKFNDPLIYQKTNVFVRLHTFTNEVYGRVCFDNVLVTEPSRASFTIGEVWLSPLQPLVSSTGVVVSATVSRELQKPTGIRLFVSHHLTTNDWGYANWWESAHGTKIELQRVEGTSTYQTPPGFGLPAQPANGTVQYVVWGIHDAIPADYTADDVIFQTEESFVRPPWYGKVDLNASNAPAFSPYYFIFSCPPGAVWINEIWFSFRTTTELYPDNSPGYEFIELAGRAGVDISGWKINLYKKDNIGVRQFVIADNTIIPNDASGWGFFVIGDEGTPNVDQEVPGCVATTVDFAKLGRTQGVELLRDNGIVEQQLGIGSSSTTSGDLNGPGDNFVWAAKLKKATFFLGQSYSLLDEMADPDNVVCAYTNDLVQVEGAGSKVWYWYYGWPTPGALNQTPYPGSVPGQTFVPVVGTSYLLTSIIDTSVYGGAHGTQNGQTAEIHVDVASGASAQVVYVAGSWYKIVAFTSNGASVPAAIGKTNYTFSVASMAGAVANSVTFGPTAAADYASDPDASRRWSDPILDWFRLRGWSEAEIAAGDDDEFTVQQEFLLNTSPVLHTDVTNATKAISCDGGSVTLTLGLDRRDAGQAVTAALQGAVHVYGAPSLADPIVWTRVDDATLPAGSFSGVAEETAPAFDAEALGLRFFIWKVE